MLKQQIEVIKKAEHEAEEIIGDAENKAAAILRSAEEMEREFVERQQDLMQGKLQAYSARKAKEKEGRITSLDKDFSEKTDFLKKGAEQKLSLAAKAAWAEIKKEFL